MSVHHLFHISQETSISEVTSTVANLTIITLQKHRFGLSKFKSKFFAIPILESKKKKEQLPYTFFGNIKSQLIN